MLTTSTVLIELPCIDGPLEGEVHRLDKHSTKLYVSFQCDCGCDCEFSATYLRDGDVLVFQGIRGCDS